MPPPGAYRALSSFEMENRTALPKTNYYTFDKSATREQMNKTYNPLDNSPRGVDIKQMPGPGHYSFKNNSVGTGGRHFSFLQKTKYAQGKLSDRFERESELWASDLAQRLVQVPSIGLANNPPVSGKNFQVSTFSLVYPVSIP